MKTYFIHGLVAGISSSIAGIIYMNLYIELFLVDFSLVITTGAIIGASMIGSLLMAIAYFLLEKINKEKFKGILNILFMFIAFISIVPVLTMSLPLEVEFPELFPGLAIPMHFFPTMAFFGIVPFFNKKTKQ